MAIVGRSVLPALIALLVLTGIGRADMMPLSQSDVRPLPPARCEDPLLPWSSLSNPFTNTGIVNLGSLPVDLRAAQTDAEPLGGAQPVCLSTDNQNNFDLCLYGLLALGLWRSAPWVKKLHFGVIPEWYHHGGPFQIGHSFAISPDCLCSAPVCCFVQPEGSAEDHVRQHHLAAVVSLWRNSQFTPAVVAPRGPPNMS